MEVQDCTKRDFVCQSPKGIEIEKSSYTLFLVSEDDREALLGALMNYYTQLRRRRALYLKKKKNSSEDDEKPKVRERQKIKEPKLIVVCKDIDNIESRAFIKKLSESPKNRQVIPTLKKCSEAIAQELKKEMSKKIGENSEDEEENSSEDDS